MKKSKIMEKFQARAGRTLRIFGLALVGNGLDQRGIGDERHALERGVDQEFFSSKGWKKFAGARRCFV